MIINRAIILEIENNRRKFIPEDVKKYLLANYSNEPFPNGYSEQGLYNSINNDIDTYESGKLDFKPKSQLERRKQECEYLKVLYIEKYQEAQNLRLYGDELERILLENNIESDKMKENKITQISI